MGILRENGDHLRSTISKCKLPKVKFPPRNVNFNLSLFYQNRSLSSIVIFRITKIFITICSLFSRTHRPWKKLNQNFKMGKTDFSIGKFDSGNSFLEMGESGWSPAELHCAWLYFTILVWVNLTWCHHQIGRNTSMKQFVLHALVPVILIYTFTTFAHNETSRIYIHVATR